jgi:hypothetical protein
LSAKEADQVIRMLLTVKTMMPLDEMFLKLSLLFSEYSQLTFKGSTIAPTGSANLEAKYQDNLMQLSISGSSIEPLHLLLTDTGTLRRSLPIPKGPFKMQSKKSDVWHGLEKHGPTTKQYSRKKRH